MQAQNYGDGDTSDLVEPFTSHAGRLAQQGNGLQSQAKAVITTYAVTGLPELHQTAAKAALENVFDSKEPSKKLSETIQALSDQSQKVSTQEERARVSSMLQAFHTAAPGLKAALQEVAKTPS